MKKSLLTFTLAISCAVFTFSLTISAQAQTFSYLADFNGANGASPEGSVVQATDGNFYGTTDIGGANGEGTVFRMTPSGDVSTIYSFCSQPKCADGAFPFAAPILGSDGNLYGATAGGGSDAAYIFGSGVIYKMTLDGKITVLHIFCLSLPCTDGQSPMGLTLASDGNFYGATDVGGKYAGGVVFQLSPAGKFKLLYTFCSRANCADGETPFSPPIEGHDGNFYGAAYGGGTRGGGVVYELTALGVYKVLYNFCNAGFEICHTGADPFSIVQSANGNFYGTTAYGGRYASQFTAGGGTVFELTSTNQYIQLASFDNTHANPAGGLTLASDGNFYGVAQDDSPNLSGTIFKITPEGAVTSLHNFFGNENGYAALGPLFQATDGNFYGTTIYGPGIGGFGTIYRLSNDLSPLVEPVPAAGRVGKKVIILGNNLTGSTGVKFNGKAATFTVVSDTEITATVPSGATTGKISVVTPSETLNSNPQFVVTK